MKYDLDKYSKCKHKLTMLTPEMAAHLLKHNHPNNRSKKCGRIDQYIRDMQAGNWGLSDQPITIDEDGILVNGQNRCEAVNTSGVAIPVFLLTGFPRTSLSIMDTGLSRNAVDAGKILGKEINNNVVAVARRMFFSTKSSGVMTNNEVLAFLESHRKAISFTFEILPKNMKGITHASGHGQGLLRLCNLTPP